jgi:hypothetical protein
MTFRDDEDTSFHHKQQDDWPYSYGFGRHKVMQVQSKSGKSPIK